MSDDWRRASSGGDGRFDDVDWSTAGLGDVRALYGRGRYEPSAVDPGTLVTALQETDTYRLTVAEAVEGYAGHDPRGLEPHLETLFETMHRDPNVAEPLGRAIGRAVVIERGVVDPLVDALAANSPDVAAAAAEGLAVAAEADPPAVLDVFENLVGALSADDPVRDPVIRALAHLYVADPAGRIDVRLRLRGLVAGAEYQYRGGAARAICLAAAEGCTEAQDALTTVTPLLEEPLGGWTGVITGRRWGTLLNTGLARQRIYDDLLAGLASVAENEPGALLDSVGTLHDASVHAGGEAQLERLLTALAAGDETVFETFLDQLTPGGAVERAQDLALGWAETPAQKAVLGAAEEQAALVATRQSAIQSLWDRNPEIAHELVRVAAREDPGAVEWAVDRLLDRVDDRWPAIEAAGSAFDALGALARSYPRIGETLTRRLVGRQDAERAATVAACRGVAAAAPESLLGRTGPGGQPVVELLAEALTGEGPTEEAAFALAHLGIRSPDAVVPLTDRVADQVRAPPSAVDASVDRAIHVLASVVTYADPEGMKSLGYTLIDQFEGGDVETSRSVEGTVLLLGALCSTHDDLAKRTVAALDRVGDDRRPTLLRVLAEAGWPPGSALCDYLPALAERTRQVDQEERAVATKAIASATTDLREPPAAVTEGLTTLLYDPDPAVRRWAAFGVGEWLATAAGSRVARDRLQRLADADVGPAVDLAVVRAGERPTADAVADLERVARIDYRAIARAAVTELGTVQDPEAVAAIERIRRDHEDPWVREAAREALPEQESPSPDART